MSAKWRRLGRCRYCGGRAAGSATVCSYHRDLAAGEPDRLIEELERSTASTESPPTNRPEGDHPCGLSPP